MVDFAGAKVRRLEVTRYVTSHNQGLHIEQAMLEHPSSTACRAPRLAAARRIERHTWWCVHAALLAALEGRVADAAALVAAADAAYHATDDRRQHNEAMEHARTLALGRVASSGRPAGAALGDVELLRLALGECG